MNLRQTLAVTGVLALTLTACDAAAEQLVEQAAEMAGGEGVDIEMDDDGGMSMETDQGSFSADSEGQINIETEDGSFSSGSELPEDLPDVPLLDDGELLNAGRYEDGDGLAWSVNYQYDAGEPGATLETAVQQLLDAGFAAPEGGEGEFDMTSGDGGGMSARILEDGQYTVTVSAIGESGDFMIGYQIIRTPPEE